MDRLHNVLRQSVLQRDSTATRCRRMKLGLKQRREMLRDHGLRHVLHLVVGAIGEPLSLVRSDWLPRLDLRPLFAGSLCYGVRVLEPGTSAAVVNLDLELRKLDSRPELARQPCIGEVIL